MKEESTDDVQRETDTSHDQNQHGIVNAFSLVSTPTAVQDITLTLQRDESLNRLEKDAHSQCQQENTIEEGTEKIGSLPSK